MIEYAASRTNTFSVINTVVTPSPARTSAKIDSNRSSAFLRGSPSTRNTGKDWCEWLSGWVTRVRGRDAAFMRVSLRRLRGERVVKSRTAHLRLRCVGRPIDAGGWSVDRGLVQLPPGAGRLSGPLFCRPDGGGQSRREFDCRRGTARGILVERVE